MKKIFTILILIISYFTTAQAQSFVWAKSFGGGNYDDGNAITVDNAGNVYTTGSFQKFVGSPVDFDPGPGTYTLNAIGQFDAFIVKLDAAGNFVWARNIGGSGGNAGGNGISVDASGNVYTTGYFSYTADFDPGIGTYTLSAPYVITNNPTDIFILKLDANGNFVWAKNIGTTFNDTGNGIILDATSNVYVTGGFSGTSDFDPGASTNNLSSVGTTDGFVLKLDASGNYVWAKSIGGSGIDAAKGITLDASGNVFTTGIYSSNADFDPSASTYTVVGQGAFVLKLDVSGNFLMALGLTNAKGNAIKVDNSGNIYTTGTFQGISDFDPSANTYTFQSSGGGADMFLNKLSASGNFIWTKNIFSNSADQSNGLELDAAGNSYIIGSSYGSGLQIAGGPTNISTGFAGDYMTILEFNNAGNLIGTNYTGGSDVIGKAIALDGNLDIHTTGNFVLTSDFNPDSPVFNLTSVAYTDVFISKLKIIPYAITNTEERTNTINFNIYPNPSSTLINIDLQNLSNKVTTIEISDNLGQTVLYEIVNSQNSVFNLSHLSKGIYFTKIKSQNGVVTKRLLLN